MMSPPSEIKSGLEPLQTVRFRGELGGASTVSSAPLAEAVASFDFGVRKSDFAQITGACLKHIEIV